MLVFSLLDQQRETSQKLGLTSPFPSLLLL